MDLCNPSEIRSLLKSRGFRFSKAMGQNFLTDSSVPERLAEGAGVDRDCSVLEIGPGIGALTAELSGRAGNVVAVELDRELPAILEITLSGRSNIEIVSGDILRMDLGSLADEKMPYGRKLVCANLPYNITTPVLTKLIDSHLFESITVMIQKEVAERICSSPGTAEYGAFTVYANYHTVPRILFDVPPSSFIPQPKVTSSVIRLDIRERPPVDCPDEKLLFRIVRASFSQRRKTLINGLASAVPLGKEELEAAVVSCGFDAKIRGETLGLEGFAAVTGEIRKRMR